MLYTLQQTDAVRFMQENMVYDQYNFVYRDVRTCCSIKKILVNKCFTIKYDTVAE